MGFFFSLNIYSVANVFQTVLGHGDIIPILTSLNLMRDAAVRVRRYCVKCCDTEVQAHRRHAIQTWEVRESFLKDGVSKVKRKE